MKLNNALIRAFLFWLLIATMICAALGLYAADFLSGGGLGSP